jgi:hypothetical protein
MLDVAPFSKKLFSTVPAKLAKAPHDAPHRAGFVHLNWWSNVP